MENLWNNGTIRAFRSYTSMIERTKIVAGTYWFGMEVEQEWLSSFEEFLKYLGERPEGHTLDRIDNSKGYLRGNVRWATPTTQTRNRRNTLRVVWEGVSLPLAELCEKEGKDYEIVRGRLKLGIPLETALSSPLRHNWMKFKVGSEEVTLPKYCALMGKPYQLVRDRLRHGWSIEQAISINKGERRRDYE